MPTDPKDGSVAAGSLASLGQMLSAALKLPGLEQFGANGQQLVDAFNAAAQEAERAAAAAAAEAETARAAPAPGAAAAPPAGADPPGGGGGMAVDKQVPDFEVDEDLLGGREAWSAEHGAALPNYNLESVEDRAKLKRFAQSINVAKRQERG